MRRRGGIKQDSVRLGVLEHGEVFERRIPTLPEPRIQKFFDGHFALAFKVPSEIALCHRRDGLDAHDWMTVDAIHLAVCAGSGEKVAEQTIALKRGGSGDNRNESRGKLLARDLHYPADAADRGRAVKGGAHLVVHNRSADRRDRLEHRRHCRAHLGGAHGAAVAGNAGRIKIRELRERLRLGGLRNSAERSPANERTSSASVEPVKSSP